MKEAFISCANLSLDSAVLIFVGIEFQHFAPKYRKVLCDLDFGVYMLHLSAFLDPPDTYVNLLANAGGANPFMILYM